MSQRLTSDHPTSLEELADALQAAVLLVESLALSDDACALTHALHRATAALRDHYATGGAR